MALDKAIIAVVPGGAETVIAAKTINHIVHEKHQPKNNKKNWKDAFKNIVKDEADNLKDEVIHEIKDKAKDEVAGKISEQVSQDDLQKISDAMWIPMINDEVDTVMGKVSHDDLDAKDFKDFIDSIVQ